MKDEKKRGTLEAKGGDAVFPDPHPNPLPEGEGEEREGKKAMQRTGVARCIA